MRFLGLIWSNLRRKKLRTSLTLLSILVAFVLFGYLVAIEAAFSMGVQVAGLDRLVVRHKISIIQFLPISYEARMESLPGVDAASHQTWFGGIYQKPTNFFAQIPVDAEELLDMYPEYILSPEEEAAWLSTKTGALVGRATANRFGWKVGDRIPIQATIWTKKDGSRTWEFDVVGIFDGAKQGTDLTNFFFRYDYFDEARSFGEGQIGWYMVRVKDPSKAAEVAAAIDREFANSSAETKAEPEGAFLQGFAKQVGNIGAIMIAILSAVFFTILIVAANTMAQSVRERTSELAVLKSLGFTHRGVMLLVLAESCWLGVTGGLVGLALAWYLISLGDPTGGALPNFYFPTDKLLIGIVLTVLLGLAAGIFPSLQALRLKIADAIRR
ncbi:MAG: FtsX-like permease family protein [Acidobacteriota bacterium]|nr:FtsX-like permease family protein [Acidobacteriota bacterium]